MTTTPLNLTKGEATPAPVKKKTNRRQRRAKAGNDAKATPSGDAPSGDAPSGDAPSGDAPSGDAPSGVAPSGDAPSGDADADPDPCPNGDGVCRGSWGDSGNSKIRYTCDTCPNRDTSSRANSGDTDGDIHGDPDPADAVDAGGPVAALRAAARLLVRAGKRLNEVEDAILELSFKVDQLGENVDQLGENVTGIAEQLNPNNDDPTSGAGAWVVVVDDVGETWGGYMIRATPTLVTLAMPPMKDRDGEQSIPASFTQLSTRHIRRIHEVTEDHACAVWAQVHLNAAHHPWGSNKQGLGQLVGRFNRVTAPPTVE